MCARQLEVKLSSKYSGLDQTNGIMTDNSLDKIPMDEKQSVGNDANLVVSSMSGLDGLEWDENGYAKGPGSNLYFQRTPNGIMIVTTVETDDGRRFICSTTTEPKRPENRNNGMNGESKDIKYNGKDHNGITQNSSADKDVLCCNSCGKYGVASDFTASGRFCSRQCAGMYAGKRKYLQKDSNTSAKTKKLHNDVSSENEVKPGQSIVKNDQQTHLNNAAKTRLQHRLVLLRRNPKSQTKVPNAKVADTYEMSNFDWRTYLSKTKSEVVPAECFVNSIPVLPRPPFEVSMKLEAVSVRQPNIIIVATIIKIQGHRLLLHADGWSSDYDFWVNVNSPDIHPAGWCQRNNYSLSPPPQISDEDFTWESYLKDNAAKAAPDHLFKSVKTRKHQFLVGMKLEAVDRQNPELICVSTITALRNDRFLVHFDGWDKSFDYWCDETCPYIHYIGWCEENRKSLIPPNGYQSPFSWRKYLSKFNDVAGATADMFKPIHRRSFEVGKKFEAVHPRDPSVIGVCTVTNVDEDVLYFRFDGHDDIFRVMVDSVEIFPVGYCNATGHHLTPPRVKLLPSPKSRCSPTTYLNQSSSKFENHDSSNHTNHLKNYAISNNESPTTARTKAAPSYANVGHASSHHHASKSLLTDKPNVLFEKPGRPSNNVKSSVVHSRLRQGNSMINSPPLKEVLDWNVTDLVKHVTSIGCADEAAVFAQELMDGESFLLLTQQDMTDQLHFKLGPALKLLHHIRSIKST